MCQNQQRLGISQTPWVFPDPLDGFREEPGKGTGEGKNKKRKRQFGGGEGNGTRCVELAPIKVRGYAPLVGWLYQLINVRVSEKFMLTTESFVLLCCMIKLCHFVKFDFTAFVISSAPKRLYIYICPWRRTSVPPKRAKSELVQNPRSQTHFGLSKRISR